MRLRWSVVPLSNYPQYFQEKSNNVNVENNSSKHIVIHSQFLFPSSHDQLGINDQVQTVYSRNSYRNQDTKDLASNDEDVD